MSDKSDEDGDKLSGESDFVKKDTCVGPAPSTLNEINEGDSDETFDSSDSETEVIVTKPSAKVLHANSLRNGLIPRRFVIR